jgi:predicted nuclease of restriction endonuclease-like (RecB) superfamily
MNYYNEIKNEIIDIETYKKVKDYSKNKRELDGYYKIGKMLIEAQGGENKASYGNKLIKEYAKMLTQDLGKGYTFTTLTRIRKFYILSQKLATVSQLLTWSHYVELLPIENINEIKYYIKIAEQQNLGVRDLRRKIKNKEYERLDDITKEKIIKNEETKIGDYIKKPILIKINKEIDIVTEKALKNAILENIEEFMKELGDGYSFIKSEYKISDYGTNNYIDILLFNYIYNCFTVVELKVSELKKEHIGQIQTYINYIDNNLKQINQNNTIGIIITKKDNKFIMNYCNNEYIYQTIYSTI